MSRPTASQYYGKAFKAPTLSLAQPPPPHPRSFCPVVAAAQGPDFVCLGSRLGFIGGPRVVQARTLAISAVAAVLLDSWLNTHTHTCEPEGSSSHASNDCQRPPDGHVLFEQKLKPMQSKNQLDRDHLCIQDESTWRFPAFPLGFCRLLGFSGEQV